MAPRIRLTYPLKLDLISNYDGRCTGENGCPICDMLSDSSVTRSYIYESAHSRVWAYSVQSAWEPLSTRFHRRSVCACDDRAHLYSQIRVVVVRSQGLRRIWRPFSELAVLTQLTPVWVGLAQMI